jgi:hypothetical protein
VSHHSADRHANFRVARQTSLSNLVFRQAARVIDAESRCIADAVIASECEMRLRQIRLQAQPFFSKLFCSLKSAHRLLVVLVVIDLQLCQLRKGECEGGIELNRVLVQLLCLIETSALFFSFVQIIRLKVEQIANPTFVIVAIGVQRDALLALHLLPSITEMVLST